MDSIIGKTTVPAQDPRDGPPRQTAPSAPMGSWELADVSALVASGQVELRGDVNAVKESLMVCMASGLWRNIPAGLQSVPRARVFDIMRDAPHRQQYQALRALYEAQFSGEGDDVVEDDRNGPPETADHYRKVFRHLLDRQTALPKHLPSAYNRQQHSVQAVIPLQDNEGAYRIIDGEILTPDELRPLRVTTDWQMAFPQFDRYYSQDPGVLLLQEMLAESSPLHALAEAIAAGLVMTPKGVIVFCYSQTNTGKSTLCAAARAATGEVIAVNDAVKSLSTTNGFNALLMPMAERAVVIYDEMDEGKCSRIAPSDLEAFCAQNVFINQKFIDTYAAPRIGAGVMVCNQMPAFTYGVGGAVGLHDGALGRIDYAPILIDPDAADAPPLRIYTRREREQILSSIDAQRYLQQWLLAKAQQFARQLADGVADTFYDIASPQTRRWIDAGRELVRRENQAAIDQRTALGDEVTEVMSRMVWTGSTNQWLPYDEIREALGVEKFPSEFKKWLQDWHKDVPAEAFQRKLRKGKSGLVGWRLVLPEGADDIAQQPAPQQSQLPE